jgi:GDP-L-fucose synthase
MTILMTGGSGFLGQNLLPLLSSHGHEVIAPRSQQLNLLDLNATLEFSKELKSSGTKVDLIIHAAAIYGGMAFMTNRSQILRDNTLINLSAFEMARELQPQKMITIGSACGYPGYLPNEVLAEDQFMSGPLHETVECYGFSKIWQQVAHRAYSHTNSLSFDHLVMSNMYGPHDVFTLERSHVVGALTRKFTDAMESGSDVSLLGDGSAQRDLIFVGDACEAILRCVESPATNEAINIGTGQGTSIKELAETLSKLLNFEGKIIWNPQTENGALKKVVDTTKMQSLLSFEATTHLEEGLKKLLDWYVPNKKSADEKL